MTATPDVSPAVLPHLTAGLLLAARDHQCRLGLARSSVEEIVEKTGASRSCAYEVRSRLLEVLPTLVRPVGRPPSPSAVPPPEADAVCHEVLRFVMSHPGCVHGGPERRQYSESFRRLVLDIHERHPGLSTELLARTVEVPADTLRDWLRVRTEAEPAPATARLAGLDSEPARKASPSLTPTANFCAPSRATRSSRCSMASPSQPRRYERIFRVRHDPARRCAGALPLCAERTGTQDDPRRFGDPAMKTTLALASFVLLTCAPRPAVVRDDAFLVPGHAHAAGVAMGDFMAVIHKDWAPPGAGTLDPDAGTPPDAGTIDPNEAEIQRVAACYRRPDTYQTWVYFDAKQGRYTVTIWPMPERCGVDPAEMFGGGALYVVDANTLAIIRKKIQE